MELYALLIILTSLVCLIPLALYILGPIKDPFHPAIFVGTLAFFVACYRPIVHLQPAFQYVELRQIMYYLSVTLASVLAFYCGMSIHKKRHSRSHIDSPAADYEPASYHPLKLFYVGSAYILVGTVFYFYTRNLYSLTGYLRDWALLWVPGLLLVLQAILLAPRLLVPGLFSIAIALSHPVDRFIIYGQRGDTFRTAVCLIPIFLFSGRRPRKPIILPAMAVLALTLGVLERTRGLVEQGSASNRVEALVQVIPSFLNETPTKYSGQEEFIYGSAMIDTVRSSGAYNYGRFMADIGVRFLPKEYFDKDALYSQWSRTNVFKTTSVHAGYPIVYGSMPSGFAHAFIEFGWLTVLFWGALGYWFHKRYVLALDVRHLDSHTYFTAIFIIFLYLITQDLYDFVTNFIYCFLPLWVGYRFARERMVLADAPAPAFVPQSV